MKKIQKVFPLLILFLFASFLTSCQTDKVKEVKQIPQGFIKLNTGGDYLENNIKYVIEENQIFFIDAGGGCIYQTALSNNDFIVEFTDDYYVDEDKYLELFDMVTVSKVVKSLPPNFTRLSIVGNYYDTNGLHFNLSETQISFYDVDENCIYQSELSNSDFIIIFDFEYYIYQKKYFELVNITTAPKEVQIKPDGFIELNKALNDHGFGLIYKFFETQISFIVAEKCIYQTDTYNDDFIVKYQDEFYVNEEQFLKIIEIAKSTIDK